eukprot:COSAG06_NODE_28624_length_571_cov_0.625000_1_plen_149_part_01
MELVGADEPTTIFADEPQLILPAGTTLVLAIALSVGIGMVVHAAVPEDGAQAATPGAQGLPAATESDLRVVSAETRNFLSLEVLDLLTDAAGYFLAESDGALQFSNDEYGVISNSLFVSVVVSTVVFAVEVGMRVCTGPHEFRKHVALL